MRMGRRVFLIVGTVILALATAGSFSGAGAEARLDAEKIGREEPALYFTHFWGKGPAEKLAKGIKAALEEQAKVSGRMKGH